MTNVKDFYFYVANFRTRVRRWRESVGIKNLHHVVVPGNLRVLVELYAIVVVNATFYLFLILIRNGGRVRLINVLNVTRLRYVIVTANRVPIRPSRGAFIIVERNLTPRLYGRANAGIRFYPYFIRGRAPIDICLQILPPCTCVLNQGLRARVQAFVLRKGAYAIISG